MAQHSAIIGGSTAGRILNCPGSHQAILALPEQLTDLPSEYALEGTFAHEVMAHLMCESTDRGPVYVPDPVPLIGRTFGDRALTREHVDTMIQPALDALDRLEEIYGGGFEVRAVEQRVKFPGVAGAFGTVDLIIENREYAILVDWKFGQGVGVRAVYSDPDSASAYVNPQAMYYLAAALRSFGKPFAKRKLVIAIIQPRGLEPLTHTEVQRKEVRWFVEDVENAVQLAIGRDPPLRRGEWCRFAPCKPTCPLWTGPLLELVALRDGIKPPQELNQSPHRVSRYGEYLARAKALADSLVMFKTTVDEQVHSYLEQGGKVPGWRLKAKAKQRQWIADDVVHAELARLGFKMDQIWQRKLVTFASADATAKKLGVKIPEELRVAPPSTETTLATTDDPAPVVEPHRLIEDFKASLQLLRQQGKALTDRS